MALANPRSEEESTIQRIDDRKRIVGGIRALRKLPRGQYDAYLYCRVLGFTETETGRILGISQQAASCLVTQAKQSLAGK